MPRLKAYLWWEQRAQSLCTLRFHPMISDLAIKLSRLERADNCDTPRWGDSYMSRGRFTHPGYCNCVVHLEVHAYVPPNWGILYHSKILTRFHDDEALCHWPIVVVFACQMWSTTTGSKSHIVAVCTFLKVVYTATWQIIYQETIPVIVVNLTSFRMYTEWKWKLS